MAKDTDCLGCGQKFKQKDAAVKCAICGLWAHKTCSGLTNEFFNCIAEQFKTTGRAYWACRSCNAYAEGMQHRLRELEESSKEAVRRGQENEKELKKLREDMEKRSDQAARRVEKSETSVMAEMNEREAKRKNVVIYGMPESRSEEGKKRMDDDKRELDNIFTLLDIRVSTEDDVEFCRRVGERSDRPRPLVVGFFTEWSKSILLKNSRYLAGTDMENLSVAPDLTHQQRKAEGELQAEADRLNEEELTEEDVAKNLVWRVVGKKGQKRMIKTINRENGGSQQTRGTGLRGRATANRRGGVRGRGRGAHVVNNTRKRTREEVEENTRQPAKRGAILPRRDRGGRFTPATGTNTEPIAVVQRDEVTAQNEGESSEDEEEVMEEVVEDEDQESHGLRLGSQSQ